MRIAVFGGSFDPIHTGHAMLANCLSQYPGIDAVWLMVSRRNPLKSGGTAAGDHHRLAMAGLVARDCAAVEVSDFELSLPEPSYTIVTLRELKKRYPGHEFRWVLGSDNWSIFRQWRDSDKILSEFGVIIYLRPGYPVAGELPAGAELAEDMPQSLISSTTVRRYIKENKNINFLVPGKVVDYIRTQGIYK